MTIDFWEKQYQEVEIESMPWYQERLDLGFERNLDDLNINSGFVLYIGTGPGIHAFALAELGFKVVGTDISTAAIKKAQIKAKEKGISIELIADDILNTKLNKEFDLILDRGCFHSFEPEQRSHYVNTITKLIKPHG